jgi:hypothetical protein
VRRRRRRRFAWGGGSSGPPLQPVGGCALRAAAVVGVEVPPVGFDTSPSPSPSLRGRRAKALWRPPARAAVGETTATTCVRGKREPGGAAAATCVGDGGTDGGQAGETVALWRPPARAAGDGSPPFFDGGEPSFTFSDEVPASSARRPHARAASGSREGQRRPPARAAGARDIGAPCGVRVRREGEC